MESLLAAAEDSMPRSDENTRNAKWVAQRFRNRNKTSKKVKQEDFF